MVDRYYQQELHSLKDLAVDFSKAHPALAPMLSGPATDPDVERLLEGVAFLTALLRRKLDDEFPELIHDLIHLIWPHYLRPLPSTTQIAFTPKPGLKQSLTIPAGIQVGSTPVEGTSCLFRTAYEVEIHPLSLLEASFQQPSGQPPAIRLLLELEGLKVSDWHPKSLRLYLAGDYPNASDLYLLLRQHLKRIVIAPQDKGTPVVLSPDLLRPVGFSSQDALIPYPSHSYPGYQIIQEYFTCPQKFLYLDLTGWERWQKRGQGSKFEIRFELEDLPFSPPRVRRENFVLFVTPAINLFPHDADPILLDHRKTEYLVRPSGTTPAHYLVSNHPGVPSFFPALPRGSRGECLSVCRLSGQWRQPSFGDPFYFPNLHKWFSARKPPAGGYLPAHQHLSRICGIPQSPASDTLYPPSFGFQPVVASFVPPFFELPFFGADGELEGPARALYFSR
jgi:type VI secretion system protein ImpG